VFPISPRRTVRLITLRSQYNGRVVRWLHFAHVAGRTRCRGKVLTKLQLRMKSLHPPACGFSGS
jgi:hypothetical protein